MDKLPFEVWCVGEGTEQKIAAFLMMVDASAWARAQKTNPRRDPPPLPQYEYEVRKVSVE